jgi:hypothetical protein
MRHEKFWGKSGGSSIAQPSVNAEEKERRLFGDALKDGVVLCLCVFGECRLVTITDSFSQTHEQTSVDDGRAPRPSRRRR